MTKPMADERIKEIWDRSLMPGEQLTSTDARNLLELSYRQEEEIRRLREENERRRADSLTVAKMMNTISSDNAKLRKVVDDAIAYRDTEVLAAALRELDEEEKP